MDRLTALNVFRNVVKLHSFAAAGRHMGLSPAAISKNISELEAYLSVSLINRTTRRMALTEAGELYYSQIEQLLNKLEEVDQSLGVLQNKPVGTLRVSAAMTVTLLCLSSVIPKFLNLYPDLSLELHLEDRRVDIVKEGYDVALRGSHHLEDSSLIARKLMTTPHVICGTPKYLEMFGVPEIPDHLYKHNCVQFSLSGHAATWEFIKNDQHARIKIDGQYKVSSSLAVRDALLADFGLSLIPYAYVRDDVMRGKLQVVLQDWKAAELSVYAVYPSRQYILPKLRVFLDFITNEFKLF